MIVFFLSGCTFTNASADYGKEGSWQLHDIVPEDEKRSGFSESAPLKKELKKGGMIHIFEGGIFSQINGDGQFDSGRWEGKTDEVLLLHAGNMPTEVSVTQLLYRNRHIPVLNVRRDGKVYKFLKIYSALQNQEEDPFHPVNNAWRFKGTQKEDAEQINEKLAGYFRHLALLLKAAGERKQNVVTFQYSKGPVKIYDGGIGIYPYPMVPDEWKNTFAEERSALQAYRAFEEYLKTSSYHGVGTGDWIVDDYNILSSIYADFKGSSGRLLQP